MRRFKTLLVVLLGAAALGAGEYDWGGQIENLSQYSNIDGETFTQADKLLLWTRAEFSPGLKFYAKGGYIYRYEDEENLHAPELSDFYLYGNRFLGGLPVTEYRLGRFRLSDRKGAVLSSLVDGFSLTLPVGPVPLRLAAGYTGLIFADSSEIQMTRADEYDKSEEDALLAPPRLVYLLEGRSGELPGGVTAFLSVTGQQDFRSEDFIEDEVAGSGRFHSQYLSAGVEGRFTPDLFYSLSGVLQTGQYLVSEPSTEASYLAGSGQVSLEYYGRSSLRPSLSLQALYATGDSWKDRPDWVPQSAEDGARLNRYTPISNGTKGFVFPVQKANLIYGDLTFSLKPSETMQLSLTSLTFFRAVDGPVSDSRISEESGSSLYLGEEVDLILNWRPLSDVGFSATAGAFLPNGELFEEDELLFRAGGYLSFSF